MDPIQVRWRNEKKDIDVTSRYIAVNLHLKEGEKL